MAERFLSLSALSSSGADVIDFNYSIPEAICRDDDIDWYYDNVHFPILHKLVEKRIIGHY